MKKKNFERKFKILKSILFGITFSMVNFKVILSATLIVSIAFVTLLKIDTQPYDLKYDDVLQKVGTIENLNFTALTQNLEAKKKYILVAGPEGANHHGIKGLLENWMEEIGVQGFLGFDKSIFKHLNLMTTWVNWYPFSMWISFVKRKSRVTHLHTAYWKAPCNEFQISFAPELEPIEAIKTLIALKMDLNSTYRFCGDSAVFWNLEYVKTFLRRQSDFYVVLLDRSFIRTVASHPDFDLSERNHAINVAVTKLYLEQKILREKKFGNKYVVVDPDDLGSMLANVKFLRQMSQMLGWTECKDCFNTWRKSTKIPIDELSKEAFDLVQLIDSRWVELQNYTQSLSKRNEKFN